MTEKWKYAIVLALAVLVSSNTSYLTTLTLNQNSPQTTNTPSPQSTSSSSPQPTSTRINALYNVTLAAVDYSAVTVYSNEVIHNLTITYQYTSLNGTDYITKIDFGTYFPIYDPAHVVKAGEIRYQHYEVSAYILSACSTIVPNEAGYPVFGIYPQLNVTEVYGYS